MLTVDIGGTAPLELQLFDGRTDRFPMAYVRKEDGSLYTAVALTHVGSGNYRGSFIAADPGYYVSTFIVYEDSGHLLEDLNYEEASDVFRAFTQASPENVADAVWEEPSAEHDNPGTFGYLINHLPTSAASAVWDELVTDHNLPNSYGEWAEATHQWAQAAAEWLADVVWGLVAQKNETIDQGNMTRAEILTNRALISGIYPAIIDAQDNINANVDIAKVKIDNLAAQLTATEGVLINELHFTDSLINQLDSKVSSLTNNTTVRFVVPERLIRPSAGLTKHYQFELRLFDSDNLPENPDYPPTITIKRLDNGVVLVNDAAMTQYPGKVGAFYFEYDVVESTPLTTLLVEAKVIKGGNTRYIPAVTEVTEFESDFTEISNKLDDLDTKTTAIQNDITNPAYGLSALQAGEAQILNHLSFTDSLIVAVKSKTDTLPLHPASTEDTEAVTAAVMTRPTITDIQNKLEWLRSVLMGTDNRNLTDVYDNQPDLSAVAKTSDPRFAFLDTPISSRSTLTAAQVWSYSTRTLTDSHLTQADLDAIWGYLTSSAMTPGSIGKLIGDFLDAAVSTRATYAQVQSLLGGVAQEDTVSGIYDTMDNHVAGLHVALAALQAIALAIKAKTDFLPSNPARESTLTGESAIIQAMVSALGVMINAIKAKTDALPSDIASATAVAAIPTNTLLTDDPRLTNLDAKISTRATPADLTGFATPADVNNCKVSITGQLDTLSLALAEKPDTTSVAAMFTPVAKVTDLSSMQGAIIAALPPPAPSTAQIWSYPTRSLTDAGTLAEKADLITLATKTDIDNIPSAHQYINRMSSVFNQAGNFHELIAWADKNGEVVLTSSLCEVKVKDAQGNLVWEQSRDIPNADGIFRFQNAIVAAADLNYYVMITITVDGVARVSTGSYITVG